MCANCDNVKVDNKKIKPHLFHSHQEVSSDSYATPPAVPRGRGGKEVQSGPVAAATIVLLMSK